jgi:hypothetical protein
MKLSRVITVIVGALIGTFAVVWWVRRRRLPVDLGGQGLEPSTWIQLD